MLFVRSLWMNRTVLLKFKSLKSGAAQSNSGTIKPVERSAYIP